MTHDTESPALSGGRAPAPPPAPGIEPPVPRQLRRSRRDRVFGGVCGGLAEYFGIDPVLLRIVAVALALSGGAGFLLYLIAWIAMPEEAPGEAATRAATRPVYGSPETEASRARSRATAVTIAGAALVAAGALMLIHQVVPWVDAALVWPLIVVGCGVAILTSGRRRP